MSTENSNTQQKVVDATRQVLMNEIGLTSEGPQAITSGGQS